MPWPSSGSEFKAMDCPAKIPAQGYEEYSTTLSFAASTNFSRVDIGGSCLLASTAAKLGTTHNIRLVCLPSELSGVWSAGVGTGAGVVCGVCGLAVAS